MRSLRTCYEDKSYYSGELFASPKFEGFTVHPSLQWMSLSWHTSLQGIWMCFFPSSTFGLHVRAGQHLRLHTRCVTAVVALLHHPQSRCNCNCLSWSWGPREMQNPWFRRYLYKTRNMLAKEPEEIMRTPGTPYHLPLIWSVSIPG